MTTALGFTKVGGTVETSWHCNPYKGRSVVPAVMDQGPWPTCVFYSITEGGQLVIHTAFADKYSSKNLVCDIILYPEDMVEEFLVRHNKERHDEQALMAMNLRSGPATAASIIIKEGVLGTSHGWSDEKKVTVESYIYHGHTMTFDDLKQLLDSGKAVVASMLTGPGFENLGPDEIYTCTPEWDTNEHGKPVLKKGYVHHMVLLTGHAVHEDTGEEYTPFLNSHGPDFAQNGIGRVFFDELLGFYSFDARYPPNIFDSHPSPPEVKQGRGKYIVPAKRRYPKDTARW